MMLRRAALALLLAGCYSPSIPNGEQQCAPGGACPEGYQCAPDNRCYRAGQLPGDAGARDLAASDLAGRDLAGGPDLAAADAAGADLATADRALGDQAQPPDLVMACANDGQCGGATPRCDLGTHLCAACLPQNDNCPIGSFCTMTNGAWGCALGCKADGDCTVGAKPKCCSNRCVDAASDGANCGGCNTACGAQTCCSSLCVDTTKDLGNCGQCGKACSGQHANWTCSNKVCTVASCMAAFLDCNMMSADGCEVSDGNDPNNCGACGSICSANNVTPQCTNSACIGPCAGGFADCNGNKKSDGCEISTTNDRNNCGGCGVVCSANNVTPQCGGSACNGACNGGFADCDGNKQANGCEVNILNDPNHCGNCVTKCAQCTNGACQVVLYGNPTPFGMNSSHSPGYLLGSPLTVTTGGSLTKFGLISRAAGPNAVMALYTDNGGNPGNLVASTPTFALNSSTQEIPVGPIAIAAGNYWILAVYDAAASLGYDTTNANAQVRYISFTLGGALPNPFPAPMSYTGQQFNYYIGVQ